MDVFYKMQSWLSYYMADTSDISSFNDTPNAEFYRKLAANQPHLVDWILQVGVPNYSVARPALKETSTFPFTRDIVVSLS